MSKLRFHVLSLPHTITSKDYLSCAYTQKVLKFCKMMSKYGHEIIHYGHEKSEVECTEHVTVTDDSVLNIAYGDYDRRKEFFKHNTADYAHQTFNTNATEEIGKRFQKNDFILCFWGYAHQPIADAFPDAIVVEPGIGYTSGTFAKFKVFESYCVMNVVYGSLNIQQPAWYDSVIPNYFDVDDFTYKGKEEKQDYVLYLGRITTIKGIQIAIDATKITGDKLIIAGQGDYFKEFGTELPDHVELAGYADVEKRKELMANAKCVMMPTYYNEPFGGVMVESLISGTPVITTDWGAFAENNLHGYTGYRCRNMEQFVWSLRNIDKIDNKYCNTFAVNNFSLEKVGLMYEEYFQSLYKVRNGDTGFYSTNDERDNMDFLTKII